ncbi:aminoglycoside resistance protein, partial [Salmonella enterica subsp. enterica serovar Enteritidis]|nr:aminoglycoside resistance protein [Salmonella enterica subsp. enterica serovar Enteritidis]
MNSGLFFCRYAIFLAINIKNTCAPGATMTLS